MSMKRDLLQRELAAPIRLEVTSGGKTETARGSGVKFTETKDTRVAGSAVWSAGPLNGSTTFDCHSIPMVSISPKASAKPTLSC